MGRRACDGPSCRSSQSSESQLPLKNLWRSVLPFRYEVQRVDFQYSISDFLSVLKWDPTTVRRGVRRFCQFFQNWSLLLKTTKQVVTPPDQTKEISWQLGKHKYEKAFTAALQMNDVSIVSLLYSQADLAGILSLNPLPFCQGVLF